MLAHNGDLVFSVFWFFRVIKGESSGYIILCMRKSEKAEWTAENEMAYRHLSGRAFASLDERGETDLVKRRQAVEKRLDKLGITEDMTNRDAVKRFLLLFSDCETSYKDAARKCGLSLTDLHAEFAMWPEGKMVKDYLLEVKKELTRVDDLEDLKLARESIREAMRDPEMAKTAKASMFVMSKLDKKQFGEDGWRGSADGDKSKAQVVYHLPGLTVNMITPPKDMTVRLEQVQTPPAINI